MSAPQVLEKEEKLLWKCDETATSFPSFDPNYDSFFKSETFLQLGYMRMPLRLFNRNSYVLINLSLLNCTFDFEIGLMIPKKISYHVHILHRHLLFLKTCRFFRYLT